MSTAKRFLIALFPSALFAFAVIAAAETALRFRYGRIHELTGAAEWTEFEWHGLSYFWDQYHPLLGWTNRPGYRSDERVPFRVTINDQGLRASRSYPPRPPAGVRRVAVFGDSCTFGEEVDNDATVPAHLESLLSDSEVLNFGVRGYGLGQMALRLEEEGFALSPDHAIVVVLLPSDIGRDTTPFFGHPKPVFRVEGGNLLIENVPVPVVWRQPWLLRHSFTAAWLWGRPQEWPAPITPQGYLEISHAIVQRMREATDARGVDLSLVLIATPSTLRRMARDGGHREKVEILRQSLANANVDVLDLIDFLKNAYDREGSRLTAPVAHWSGRGNRLIAEAIAAHLGRRRGAISAERYPAR
jgi:hypothetical protein